MKTYSQYNFSKLISLKIFGKPVGEDAVKLLYGLFYEAEKAVGMKGIIDAFDKLSEEGRVEYSDENAKVYDIFDKGKWELDSYNLDVAETMLNILKIK